MNYKREEAFRYKFEPPLTCLFSIAQLGEKNINTKLGEGLLLDISPKGMKIGSRLDIPNDQEEIKMNFHLTINTETIITFGTIAWKSKVRDGTFQYGIHFIPNDTLSQEIIEEVKTYARLKPPR